MEDKCTKLRIVGHDKGGRCRYDAASKRVLIEACLCPGVSVARLAQENGINANLLRKWITRYLLERERSRSNQTSVARMPDPGTRSPATAQTMPKAPMPRTTGIVPATFVPIVATNPATTGASSVVPTLHVRLPNGVHFDLEQASLETVSGVVQMLGRLPCSGSTQD